MDDNELYSCSNPEDDDSAFDLNSFSSKAEAEAKLDKKRRKKNRPKKEKILKTVLTVCLICLITGSIVVGSFLLYAFTMVDGSMDVNLNDLSLNFTTTIYVDSGDGNYTEYQRLHGEFNRIWVAYDKVAIEKGDTSYQGIPQNLVNAFVAIEDKRFFEHDGVDWKRTVAAFINEFVPIYSSRQGGSTITQQLVKNLTGDNSQKPSRKVREIMRARELESKYSKDTIIECYLNTIPLGHGTYGVEVAANYYFGKSVNELNLAECACIAAITKAPSNYAPDDNPEANETRRNNVLYEMLDQGYITEEEYNTAKETELNVIASKEALNETEINSYFVDALIDQVIEDLADKYGYDYEHASDSFYSAGYKIYATLDPNIQSSLEKVFNDTAYAVEGKDGQTLQGSMTVMDYNGNVKGLVGGIGEKTENRGFNRATDAVRQPGSTMKPIAAYAPAIENDLIHYSSIVNDTKKYYKDWAPVNWYGGYWGNITVQYALERSVNTIPVYLVEDLGTQTSYDFLTQKLGISTLTAEDVNLSPLGMGGTNGGLTTIESAAAYAVFGNGGLYYEPTLYTEVKNQKGDTILSKKSEPKMAISEDTATVMNHLLQQVVYGSEGTGKAAASYIPSMKIYAKTGTSNDQNDLWFVGGTPYYVASCWCGYDTQQPIPSKNSGIALKMWGNAMSQIHSGLKAKEFENSSYAVEKYYCTSSGKLATDACPNKALGWYKKSNLPDVCDTHPGEVYNPEKNNESASAEE
ncbi:MAG: PBP1A family penicillin-binding protein [Clostridia bacterium]|nr:PBP1A family penicillin-binding protein [Clostridia bacterium]